LLIAKIEAGGRQGSKGPKNASQKIIFEVLDETS